MSDNEPTIDDVIESDDLSEFEQQVVEQFNAREAQASSPSDEDSADASPSPGSEADAAPAPSGAALDFVEPVDDVDPEPVVDEPVAPTPTVWDGVDDTQQQMARGVYDWYTKLDPTAVATVDAALSGNYVLVPVDQIDALQQNWNQLQGAKESPVVDDDQFDMEDPTAREVAELRDRVAQFEDRQQAEQVQAQISQEAQVIDQTYDYWRDQHSYLSDDECARLQNWVIENGAYGVYAQQFDPQQATLKALDQALFSDAELRSKAVQPLIDERVREEMLAAQEQAARGMRASAVAGASASEPDTSSLDPESAMIEDIRRALEGM